MSANLTGIIPEPRSRICSSGNHTAALRLNTCVLDGEPFRMKTSTRVTVSTLAAVLLGLAATSSVHAIPVIANGGFESGLTSWTRVDQLGSEGTFFSQSGTLSPVNGNPVPAPPEGSMAAMTDADGPGSHVLYQDFAATAGGAALSFALFIGNRADRFVTPASLDFITPALNQQARVDILKNTTDPFSVAATDVL